MNKFKPNTCIYFIILRRPSELQEPLDGSVCQFEFLMTQRAPNTNFCWADVKHATMEAYRFVNDTNFHVVSY